MDLGSGRTLVGSDCFIRDREKVIFISRPEGIGDRTGTGIGGGEKGAICFKQFLVFSLLSCSLSNTKVYFTCNSKLERN